MKGSELLCITVISSVIVYQLPSQLGQGNTTTFSSYSLCPSSSGHTRFLCVYLIFFFKCTQFGSVFQRTCISVSSKSSFLWMCHDGDRIVLQTRKVHNMLHYSGIINEFNIKLNLLPCFKNISDLYLSLTLIIHLSNCSVD